MGMLVLARQRDQTIVIGENIEVTVVDVRGDKVRLGINAPKSVSVHRKEVFDAIRRENQSAAQMRPDDIPSGPVHPPMKLVVPDSGVSHEVAAIHRPFLQAAIEEAKMGFSEG